MFYLYTNISKIYTLKKKKKNIYVYIYLIYNLPRYLRI